jgi:Glyoxalase/Bleomycin resistance protein/Dioxygenase superfamily
VLTRPSASLFLVSDVGITVSGICRGVLCERALLSLSMSNRRSLRPKRSGFNDEHSHRIAGSFLQLIAKIMSVPECCARFRLLLKMVLPLIIRINSHAGGVDAPKTDGILESSLYVSDVARSVRFYQETFGFFVVSDFGERGCAMHGGPQQVLLLFKKGASRTISSPHDGDGELHVAFAIPGDELPNWES